MAFTGQALPYELTGITETAQIVRFGLSRQTINDAANAQHGLRQNRI